MKNMKVLFFCFLALGLVSAPVSAWDNSPSNYQVVPEVIWAPASGGGTWSTQIQIIAWTAGTVLTCYFDYGTGFRTISSFYTFTDYGDYIMSSNWLATLDAYDAGAFAYYGRVGAVDFFTQDSNHKIQVTAKTVNGNYGKTFPGLNNVDANLAKVSVPMVIPFVVSNSAYRSTIGIYNPSGVAMTAQVYIMNQNYAYYDTYSVTLNPYYFIAHDPFTYAGLTGSYSHTYIFVWPTAGSGSLICFGATSNNTTNDPSALIAQHHS